MSNLPRVSGRECAKALEKAGFIFRRQKGSHMTFTRKEPYAQVIVPAHKELGKGILRSIIREAGLSVEEFARLLD